MELVMWGFKYIGGTICLLSGVLVTALLVGYVAQYSWEKIRLAYSIVEIQRAVKAYKNKKD
ncbi:hypothetical protein HX37_25870 [Salmonella enterica]|uniref:Uncharacterized protein n=1 Tax=Salmonella enterica TaxID=28901 RepID=A0A5U2F912_SALER|nr:hypothetical protein [Salmonella enterica]